MTRFLIKALLILCFSSTAYAHPVDEFRYRAPHLGLNDPFYFSLSFEYWHERRELVADLRDYGACVGGVNQLLLVLNRPVITGDVNILTYWDVIPATPLEEQPGNVAVAQAHINAAIATRAIFQINTFFCKALEQGLRNEVKAKLARCGSRCA